MRLLLSRNDVLLSKVAAGAASSFEIVPVDVTVFRPDDVTVSVKVSFGSTAILSATRTVIVLVVSPAAKVPLPLGSIPPKSAASAKLLPKPVTAQLKG